MIKPIKKLSLLWALILSLLVISGLMATPTQAIDIYDLPDVNDNQELWMIDQAEVISRINEGKLNRDLAKLANDTGTEVHLVAISRVDIGENLDDLIDEVFETWFPTPDAQANQTLLMVDTLTTNTAIRTGTAVKEIMPDATATSVAFETVGVPLRESKKFNQAFLDASARLIAILSGEPDPGPPTVKQINTEGTFADAEETEENKGSSTIWVIGLLIAATVIPMATYFWYVGFNN